MTVGSANRLHENKLDDFKAYALARNRTVCPTKGEYEVLRLRFGKKPLMIFYQRDGKSQHLTASGRHADQFVTEYLNDKKKGRWKDGKFK